MRVAEDVHAWLAGVAAPLLEQFDHRSREARFAGRPLLRFVRMVQLGDHEIDRVQCRGIVQFVIEPRSLIRAADVGIERQHTDIAVVGGVPPFGAVIVGQIEVFVVQGGVALVVAKRRQNRHASQQGCCLPEEVVGPVAVIAARAHQIAGHHEEARGLIDLQSATVLRHERNDAEVDDVLQHGAVAAVLGVAEGQEVEHDRVIGVRRRRERPDLALAPVGRDSIPVACRGLQPGHRHMMHARARRRCLHGADGPLTHRGRHAVLDERDDTAVRFEADHHAVRRWLLQPWAGNELQLGHRGTRDARHDTAPHRDHQSCMPHQGTCSIGSLGVGASNGRTLIVTANPMAASPDSKKAAESLGADGVSVPKVSGARHHLLSTTESPPRFPRGTRPGGHLARQASARSRPPSEAPSPRTAWPRLHRAPSPVG